MEAGVVHPRSPIDTEKIYDGTREIPSRDLMSSVDELMMGTGTFNTSPLTTPRFIQSPPKRTTAISPISPLRSMVEPGEESDFETSPSTPRLKRPIDVEDVLPLKRRMYIPPPTGHFVNSLESIDYDIPPFSRFDSDLRQDWLDKMQSGFTDISKNYSHFPKVELEPIIEPAYLRRAFIRLKNMSDATLVENWVHRLKVMTFAGICVFELVMKYVLKLDIGPFAETCMNPSIAPYFESAFKSIYKLYISGFGGTDHMNPMYLLGGVLTFSLVISVGLSVIKKKFNGMEIYATQAVQAFIRFFSGTGGVKTDSTSSGHAALPSRATGNETLLGQDPISFMQQASSMFSQFDGSHSTSSRKETERETRNSASGKASSSGQSAFAF